ncbi:hypothetical protein MW887_010904 [Aspergillus wentii]|nr:hypothetical protein MW887_010904 [Aspergillus wentii]
MKSLILFKHYNVFIVKRLLPTNMNSKSTIVTMMTFTSAIISTALEQSQRMSFENGVPGIAHDGYGPNELLGGLPRADGDLVAISLISKESLENRYAPDGTFRSPQSPRRPHSVLSKPERFKSIKGFFKRKSEAKQKHPQHSPQTPTVENQRKEWKLAYLHESSTWVVSSGSDGWTQSYTLGESRRETYQRSQSTQPANLSGSALPVYDILTQIGTYAKSHAIQNVAGLRKIMDIPPSLHQVNGAHVGSLRCWLDDEKHNSGREGLCPESGVTILSNGFSKRLLAWDTCGRHRLIDGQDLCRIVPAVIGHPNGDLETVRLSLGAVAQYLLQSGNVRAAEELYWDLFEAIRALDGSLDLEFIVLCGLGHTYNKQEMRERAIMIHMKALDSCENIYGSSGVNSFTILTQMATNYERLGQIANAMSLYQRALQGRLDCDQQEDALDDKEKLGELNQALGRNTQAARLFDEVYRGFQELLGPHHRKTLLAMTNLSALLFATGHPDRGISLLLTAVPLAYRILGPDDQVSMACVCNYLIYSPTTRLQPSIQTVTDQYLSRNNQSSLNVLKSLAELYGKKGMGRQAVETYKLLSERIKSVSGTSNPMILDALYGYAFSLQCVGRFSESMEQYRHLHSLAVTLHPAQSQSWINIVKISLEGLNKTKADLDQENLDWGLDVPQVCSDETCPNMTKRVCSKCKMNRFCSLTCESRSREAYHQAWCIASVTISESMSVLIKYTNDHINRDSMAASLMLNLRLLRKPRCVSFKTVFINPITFMTLRISKKPENLLVVYPSPTTNLRFGVQNSMPFQWMTSENCGALLIERRADAYLIVAPEKNKMADLQGERDKNFGIESDEVDLPGEDLIEYAQWTEKSGGKTTFVSAFALVEWSVE